MSSRFNLVSTGVAAATATLILGIAGCAMNSQPAATTDQTDSAALATPPADTQTVAQADTSAMPASPATDVTIPATEPAPTTTTAMANDSGTVPLMDQPPAAGTPTYPASTTTATDSSMPSTTSSTTTASTDTTSAPASNDQPLPPRTDRN